MIWILKGNLGDMGCPRVERRRNDKPCTYCLHISPLQAKVVMIMGAKTKRRLPQENRRDIGVYSSWHQGLHAEQGSPNRLGGQMLATNFSN